MKLAKTPGWSRRGLRTYVVLEQLNHGQWHAYSARGHATGVQSYVGALADALVIATANDLSVVSINLAGEPLILARRTALWFAR